MTRPRRSPTALVLVDVVNPFDFEGGEALFAHARPMAMRLAGLRRRARDAGVPAIYVNDHFGCWHLGFREIVERVRARSAAGRALLEAVEPDPATDYFILKPMHSAFFHTAFEVLLQQLGVRRLILTGVAGDICVLFTASDAHMRGYALHVPADCIASERPEDNARALRQMERLMKADVRPSDRLAFATAPPRSARGAAPATR